MRLIDMPNYLAKSTYTPEIGIMICDKISSSHSGLAKIASECGVTSRTVFNWIASNMEFREMYDRAKAEQADLLVDEILEISDRSDDEDDLIKINRDKLRTENRKWIAAKLKPKVYGNNSNVEHDHKVAVTVSGEQYAKLVAAASSPDVEDIEHEEVK